MDGFGRPPRRPPAAPSGPVMTVVANKHVHRVVLGAALLLALAAGVLAASGERAISLVPERTTQAAGAGDTVRYRIKIERDGGFDRRVAIYARGFPAGSRVVWRLPSGATLPRAYSRGPTVIVPARHRAAVVSATVPAGTEPGSFRPSIRAYGWGVRATRTLGLDVRPGVVVSPAPAPSFTVRSAQAGRAVLQGDSASWDIAIERAGGLTAPIAMSVAGLPAGASASWSNPEPIAGDAVTMTVATTRATPVGSYELTMTGAAAGMTESALATLDVLETKPFGIAGNAAAPLRPGGSSALDLALTNPYDFPLRVERIDVRVAGTGTAGCGAANYGVEQPAGAFPVTVPPGTTQLSSLVPAGTLPRVTMRESGADQDACKGAQVQLAYEGVAGR